ncbi:alpha/beta hydrolase fold domain-containing protein [Actinomadura fibrosa]|uniref:Alpha/beta hydrolase fold domain-containing protein n=1 Tax=Actinomadura fibrosa TaxID=111802 RepID=A0ABW2XEY4_9ACTN|nr:alpha/beta hydrolase fold domain-containing protein [Actinomadura fibrosa]
MDDHGEETAARVLALPQAPDAIELRHLRSFVAVAEELNFGRAAARLYLSQPALSRQIRGLERLIGCDLLNRSTHRVELTLAGEALLDKARTLLAGVDDAVSAARSVGGELAERAARLWKPVADHNHAGGDEQRLAAEYEALLAAFDPPPEVAIRPVKAGGVPGLRLAPADPRPGAVLHLHGGGFVMGSAYGYRPLAGALAAAAETTVLVPDYALAPESPFPAAVEDSVQSYLWLLDQGTDPGQVIISGDSSGAGLAVSVLLWIKRHELPPPAGAVLMCPWADLAYTLPETIPDDPQLVITGRLMRRCVDHYLAGHPLDDPVVNPLGHPEALAGLPPLLIQAGTGDHLLDQARTLAERAREQDVNVTLELYPVNTHGFHLFWPFLPEAMRALEQAGAFIRGTAS